MSCPCNNKITTELKCTNCGRQLSLRHAKTKDALTVAQKQNKKCSKCGEKNFTVVT